MAKSLVWFWKHLSIMIAATFAIVGAALITEAGLRVIQPLLVKWAVVDSPGSRSSHSEPTLTGGGMGVIPPVAVLWIAFAGFTDDRAIFDTALAAGGCAVLLALISWRDDVAGLSIGLRLSAHAVAVVLLLIYSNAEVSWFSSNDWRVLALIGIALVWFMNIFNFMDGIDGISGVEIASICLGTALVAYINNGPEWLWLFGLVGTGAALAFLRWNWAPARVFLGDTGSIPMGFLLGWLLLALATTGAWAAAIILPLYYIMDSSITLIRRSLRLERIWIAHREHYYQRAVQLGASHAQVSVRIAALNTLLILLAIASLFQPWLSVAGAVFAVSLFLRYLASTGTIGAPQ